MDVYNFVKIRGEVEILHAYIDLNLNNEQHLVT